MQICHTDDRIYGVQLVLGHHREKFEGEDDLVERYGQKLHFQAIDENIANSAPMRMNFIGNDGEEEGAKCEWAYFFDKGQYSQLDEIVAYTDSYGVKGLELTVLHNEGIEAEYEDLQFGARPSDDLKATVFTFEQGLQLLGIEGIVEIVETEMNTADRLLMLNFFRDKCARTTRLYLERDANEKIFTEEWEREPKTKHWIAEGIGALVILYVLICNCILCYCGILNR